MLPRENLTPKRHNEEEIPSVETNKDLQEELYVDINNVHGSIKQNT